MSSVRALAASVIVMSVASCTFLVESDDLIRGLPPGVDAATSADAAREAGIDTITSAACGAPNTFCDDFEGKGTVTWKPLMTGNATVVVDGVKPATGEKSLHASRAPGSGRESAKYFLSLPGRLRSCEFDVFGTTTALDTTISFLKFGYDRAQAPFKTYQVNVQIGGSIGEFADRSPESPLYHEQSVPQLERGRWHHVALELAADSATLKVGGEIVVDRFPLASATGSDPYVVLGMDYQSSPNTGWEVFVDNVVCVSD